MKAQKGSEFLLPEESKCRSFTKAERRNTGNSTVAAALAQETLPAHIVYIYSMTMQEWFDAYGESHQNRVNKAIHWICVPAIFFSLIAILSGLRFDMASEIIPPSLQDHMHLGTLVIVFGLIFFARLSRPIMVGMAVISFIILKAIGLMNTYELPVIKIAVLIFILAWIGQFIGHKIEGKKPAFIDDLKFLLIGPAWLLGFVYRKLNISY